MSNETIQWVLARDEHRVTCSIQPGSNGSHVAVVTFDGLPVKRCERWRSSDVIGWSAELRAAWQMHGWQPLVD
ncbi:MAG TPA: hypothetical protein VH417_02905 [Vicinamibacterales bacterium]